MPDDLAELEIGLVHVPAHGHVQFDQAVAVLQEGQAQLHGQVHRLLAAGGIPEGELVHADGVLTGQLAVFHQVAEVQIQLALFDGVAHVAPRVGAQGCEVDPLGLERHLRVGGPTQEIHLAADLQRGGPVDPGVQGQVGAGLRVRGQVLHVALQRLQGQRGDGLDGTIQEYHPAAPQVEGSQVRPQS